MKVARAYPRITQLGFLQLLTPTPPVLCCVVLCCAVTRLSLLLMNARSSTCRSRHTCHRYNGLKHVEGCGWGFWSPHLPPFTGGGALVTHEFSFGTTHSWVCFFGPHLQCAQCESKGWRFVMLLGPGAWVVAASAVVRPCQQCQLGLRIGHAVAYCLLGISGCMCAVGC
jgi:hypothetical protein